MVVPDKSNGVGYEFLPFSDVSAYGNSQAIITIGLFHLFLEVFQMAKGETIPYVHNVKQKMLLWGWFSSGYHVVALWYASALKFTKMTQINEEDLEGWLQNLQFVTVTYGVTDNLR